MTLKKTIVISIVFHLCLFSAALLFVEGSGKRAETEIIFISLAADAPKAVSIASVLQRVQAVKKIEKPLVIDRKKEAISAAEVVVEKVEEINKIVIPEEVVPVASEIVSEEDVAGEIYIQEEVFDNAVEAEVAQTVQDQPASGSHASAPPGQGIGILPGTIELISMAIERVKIYPLIARKRGIEGTVHVSFNVMADGNPYGIKIFKSSGFSILDNATVKVVKKAAPFPLIASRIELPIAYRLRN